MDHRVHQLHGNESAGCVSISGYIYSACAVPAAIVIQLVQIISVMPSISGDFYLTDQLHVYLAKGISWLTSKTCFFHHTSWKDVPCDLQHVISMYTRPSSSSNMPVWLSWLLLPPHFWVLLPISGHLHDDCRIFSASLCLSIFI